VRTLAKVLVVVLLAVAFLVVVVWALSGQRPPAGYPL
jgi:cbb3-type cytochrome oxidase subunit 3